MKKVFKNYLITWAILLAVYNVVVFSVQALPAYDIVYDARFWISWAFIMAAFVGQLVCTFFILKGENLEKVFFNIPLIKESYVATILMTIAGSVCMLIPDCPTWIATIVCIVVAGFSVIGVFTAKTATNVIADADRSIKIQTFFIKTLTVDADTLVAMAKSEEIKAECVKVYDAIRYSDPMSNEALSAVEGQITLKFSELRAAVEDDDLEMVQVVASALLVFVRDRNNKCQLLK